MEFGLLIAAVMAMVTAGLFIILQRRRNVELPDRPFDRVLGAAMVGLFSGRLVELVLMGINPFTDPGQLVLVRGGVNTVAASVAAGGTLLFSLRNRLDRLDALAPAIVAGLAGWHLGCVAHGSCLGSVTDLPWGWALSGSDIARHPVELYTVVLLVGATLALMKFGGRVGAAAALAVVAIAGSRLITEPMRIAIGEGLWLFYLVATVGGIVAAIWLNASAIVTTRNRSGGVGEGSR